MLQVGWGRMTLPKEINFRKSSKQPLTPTHFGKIMLKIFYQFHAQKALFQGQNLQHEFLEMQNLVEGEVYYKTCNMAE